MRCPLRLYRMIVVNEDDVGHHHAHNIPHLDEEDVLELRGP